MAPIMKNDLNRRDFLKTVGLAAASLAMPGQSVLSQQGFAGTRPPNFIIIFCDDLGYGDIGCFGSRKNRTPNLDRMAAEGTRFTSFYVTSGVCTPSRSSLMTGCYPRRVNMHQNDTGLCVLFPVNKKGLNPEEITIAEVLKTQGYATACIGKWHLGDQPAFLPTRQGFNYYYGIPYSNDMGSQEGTDRPPLPLLRNEKVIEAPADQNTLTKRYTEEAVKFIKENKARPFFIYLPHTMPHEPLHVGEAFRGRSANGDYGDVIEELDWSVGQILQSLRELNLADKTMVVFTSDNGATGGKGRSNSPLRGSKGTTWEGGQREPCILWWPDHVPTGKSCDELTTTMDLLPTFARLAGTDSPRDRIIDGKDIWPLMSGKSGAKSPHEAFYYYQMDQLQAVRCGKWKLHLPLEQKKKNWGEPTPDVPLQLYDLQADIGEANNVANKHPDIVKQLLALAQKAREDLGDVDRPGKGQRPAGWVENPKPLLLKSK
jgi:arylsulfatase A-like enzyme